MRRVISVSLNGNAYQLEDDAHALLEQYLETAGRALADNPDREEIVADLEQAIAEKCARFLGAGRTVLKRADVAIVVDEMGPVQAGEGAEPGAADAASPPPAGDDAGARDAGATGTAGGPQAGMPPPRRLYQINEGAYISGLCNGLAAYFDVDVTFVRIGVVVLALISGGIVVLGYLLLMFIVPVASTSEERAAAHGAPFNARVLVERAKEQAAQFAQSPEWQRSRDEWRRGWQRGRAQWRRSWQRTRRDWQSSWSSSPRAPRAPSPPPGFGADDPPRPYGARVLTGVVATLLALLLAAMTIAWLLALVSLVSTEAIFGWKPPGDHGFWLALALLAVAWSALTAPVKWLMEATQAQRPERGRGIMTSGDSVVWFAVIGAAAWYGYGHVPEVRDFVDQAWGWVSWQLQLR